MDSHTPELIYCAGKSAPFEAIARDCGYKIGARLPCTFYSPELYFADNAYKNPDRAGYMRALAQHRPTMATVLDIEQPDQLAEVLSWAEESAQYVQRVLFIPKCRGIIQKLPRRIGQAEVVLAYSVQTSYGGTTLSPNLFAGWPVHLLGGAPHLQYRLWDRWFRHVADVVSIDGNMANKLAHRCFYWSLARGPKGHWRQLSDSGDLERGNGANGRAFRLSCLQIQELWQTKCLY